MIGSRRRPVLRRAAAAFLLASVVGACTYESGGDAVDGTTTTSAGAVTTAPTVAGSSSTTASPATTRPPANCPPPPGAPGFPPDASEVSEALGDFDGNGAEDQLQAYATSGSRPWHLRVLLITNFTAELRLDEPSHRGERAQAVGGADVGNDDADEILAVVGRTRDSSATEVGLFVFRECRLEAVRDEQGELLRLPVGGTSREGHGIECGDKQLTLLTAESRDGRFYTTSRTVGRVDGTTFRTGPTEAGGSLSSPRDDGFIRLHYEIRCGTLGLGPQAASGFVSRDRED